VVKPAVKATVKAATRVKVAAAHGGGVVAMWAAVLAWVTQLWKALFGPKPVGVKAAVAVKAAAAAPVVKPTAAVAAKQKAAPAAASAAASAAPVKATEDAATAAAARAAEAREQAEAKAAAAAKAKADAEAAAAAVAAARAAKEAVSAAEVSECGGGSSEAVCEREKVAAKPTRCTTFHHITLSTSNQHDGGRAVRRSELEEGAVPRGRGGWRHRGQHQSLGCGAYSGAGGGAAAHGW
jgi:hypothetical protein